MLVRYYGHVGLPTGYGDAAAEMCMAILSAGLDLEISTDGKALPQRFLPLATCIKNEADLSPPDAIIVHTLPMDCAKLLALSQAGDRYPRARRIAYTTWEGASLIPQSMAVELSHFDQIWVPSTATARCVTLRHAGAMNARVCVVPHAFDESLWSGDDTVTEHSIGEGPYRFYYVGAWVLRKNVDGLIRAYLRAFDAEDDVELVIQSSGARDSACQIAQLATGLQPGSLATIRFSNRRMSYEEIQALHRECHCFVTATRGEAWNIPAFEAMLARRHLIVPSGSGSDDFLKGTSAALYDSRLSPAYGEVELVQAPDAPPGYGVAHYVGHQGLSVLSDWRDPDLGELADLMALAYSSRRTGLTISSDPVSRFGRAAVGRRILDLLQGVT